MSDWELAQDFNGPHACSIELEERGGSLERTYSASREQATPTLRPLEIEAQGPTASPEVTHYTRAQDVCKSPDDDGPMPARVEPCFPDLDGKEALATCVDWGKAASLPP